MSTASPTRCSGSRPPAALVSTTVRQPARTAVRTPWTTSAGPWPSYRWTRPAKASTLRPPAVVTDVMVPLVTGDRAAGEAGQLGSRDLGADGSERRRATRPNPDPSTIGRVMLAQRLVVSAAAAMSAAA